MRRSSLILVLALSACGGNPTQAIPDPAPELATVELRVSAGEAFRLSPGEVVASSDGALLIGFRGVDSDSRCPSTAVCVWMGNAVAVIGTALPGTRWTWHELNTSLEPRAVVVSGYRVELLQLDPYPDGQRIPPSAYIARLRITRL